MGDAPGRVASHLGLAAALVIGTLLVYQPVSGFDFVNYDDPDYVTRNPMVLRGLTLEGVGWALTTGHHSNWHPLTWLSHMLDVEIFGVDAGRHHAMSVLLHAINALLLFWLLSLATRRTLPAAVVAALFAWHPLHVESVAWISERKDLLSTGLGLLALLAYVAWVRRGGSWRYAAVVVTFAGGLMAKPMLVSLPLLMLLLDFWPLERWRHAERSLLANIVVEKLPLLALSVASSLITLGVQDAAGAMGANTIVPVGLRVANAVASYARYLWKTIWPLDLGIMVPHPNLPGGTPLSIAEIGGSVAGLVAISALALWGLRRHPYLACGWTWFLVSLVPVIGIVQVGAQAMADRYTYLPLIGVFVALVYLGTNLLEGRRPHVIAPALAATALLLVATAVMARHQVGYWRDSVTILRHSIETVGGTPVAFHQLGTALDDAGRPAEAVDAYRRALALNPGFHRSYNNLANALVRIGRADEAIPHYRAALRYDPDYADAHNNLAGALLRLGQSQEAVVHFREAARLKPTVAAFRVNLGMGLLSVGDDVGARSELETGLRLDPGNALARKWLAHLEGR